MARKGRRTNWRMPLNLANTAFNAYNAYNNYKTARNQRARSRSFGSKTIGSLTSNPFPITGQADARTTYRRRRMPYRKRKNWVRFSRKVQAVVQKTLASHQNIILRNGAITTAVNKQANSSIHTAMGLNGNVTSTSDVSKLLDLALLAGYTSDKDAAKIQITGWLLETQIVNESTSTAYVDMYYWRCKKAVPATLPELNDVWTNALSDITALFPVGGSALDAADYGVTPFQGPGLARNIRIWKKVRTKLDPSGVTQVESRSGKNYLRNWSHDEEYAMDTCTEGVFFVFYGAPTAANPTASSVTLRFSTNANYSWRVLQSADQTGGTTQL